jgi:shikimate kinase
LSRSASRTSAGFRGFRKARQKELIDLGTKASLEPVLVLISGPIASGKTTAILGLASLARQWGLPAAAIDIDELVEMTAGDWSQANEGHRRLAWQLASVLIDKLIQSGIVLIAVGGSTLSPKEWDELLKRIETAPQTLYVRLRVSFEEALQRARSDPDRVSTKDGTFLAQQYKRLDWTGVDEPDISIETDDLLPGDVASQIAQRLFAK